MPYKIRHNTNYPPFTVRDLIARGENVGITNLLNDDIIKKIGNDWIFYITQTTSYRYNSIEPFVTNILTAYIYDNFKDRVILGKYANDFDGWDEQTDFAYYTDAIKRTIEYTLTANKEKYNKLYYAMVAEFNPLWNVDGETITERELHQTGTIDDTHRGEESTRRTGTDENARRGTETTTHTGNETNSRTGTETNVKDETEETTKTGTDTTARTGTDSTARTGTDTRTTANTTYDSAVMYDTERITDTPNTTDTTTHNTTDTTTHNTTDTTDRDATDTLTLNTNESLTRNLTDGVTHNTTDTTTHNTTDAMTRNLTDSNERNLTDRETIIETRHGNIGVTTTTKLLTEFVEYADLVKFLDIICRDVVNSFTYMTY